MPYLSAYPVPDADVLEGVKAELKDRETMGHWASKQVEKNTLRKYQAGNNAYSLDGLPGFRVAIRDSGQWIWWARMRAWVRRMIYQKEAMVVGAVIGMVVLLLWQTLIPRQ